MTKTTQPFLPAPSTWSLKTCHITTADSANNGRHYRVVSQYSAASAGRRQLRAAGERPGGRPQAALQTPGQVSDGGGGAGAEMGE